MDKILKENFVTIGNEFTLLGKENFFRIIFDKKNDSRFYFQEKLQRELNDFKIIIDEDSDSTDYDVFISGLKINTGYKKVFTDNIFGEKKAEREVKVSFVLGIKKKLGREEIFKKEFNNKITDSVEADKEDSIEDIRFDFTQASLPEESLSHKLLIPSLIIISSAVAIILFFTIRSK